MFKNRRRLRSGAVALLAGAGLLLAACGNNAAGKNDGLSGEPQSGGTGTMLIYGEPGKVDPAGLRNSGPRDSTLGNALYGQLFTTDEAGKELTSGLAESVTTTDGLNWELKLRPDLEFTDGSPLDAEAVKFNWLRHQDKALASGAAAAAASLESVEAKDEVTVAFKLRAPNAQYGQVIVSTALNWMASPTALKKGPEDFEANPVGAGPFVLTKWARGNSFNFDKNPDYWDSPRPYLDKLILRPIPDSESRFTTLQTGGADLSYSGNGDFDSRAGDAGFEVGRSPLSGGYASIFNTRRAPFDDPATRLAVVQAIDNGYMDKVLYKGHGEVPVALFRDGSPFYDSKVGLPEYNKAAAQKQFDKLAAEGKPLEFTIMAINVTESVDAAEATQSQLESFDNVKVNVEPIDYVAVGERTAAGEFDVQIGGFTFKDPEPLLYDGLHSGSPQNISGLSDPAMDAALDLGRTSSTLEERQGAYAEVQRLWSELNPMHFWGTATTSVMMGKNVTGVSFYGNGSIRVETVWKAS